MTNSGVRIWVAVESRDDIDEVRLLGIAEAYVVSSGNRPIYGRPGDTIYVRLTEADVAGPLQPLSFRIPINTGVVVPASARGLLALNDLRTRGRQLLAAEVRSPAEFLLVGSAGAQYAIVSGADGVRNIGDVATSFPPLLVSEVGSLAEMTEALQAGAAGVLMSRRLLNEVLEGPKTELAASAPQIEPPASMSRTSPQADPETLAGLLEKTAAAHPSRDAIVHVGSGLRMNYSAMREQARSVAKGLHARGVRKGDRVALLARNVAEWPIVQFGTAYIGAILVPVNPSLTQSELKHILSSSGASLLIAGPHADRSGSLDALPRELPQLRTIVALGGEPAGSGRGWNDFIRAGSAMSETELDEIMRRLDPDDVINIQYTSGTTGFAKGAMLTHRGIAMNAAAVSENLRLAPSDRLCLPVPFFHCFGCVLGTVATVSVGATLVIPADWFDATRTLQAIASEQCTAVHGVPTMFRALLEELKSSRYDLGSLRTGIVAGSAVSSDLMEQISSEMGVPQMTIAYGLTEASPVVTQTPIDASAERRFGTVGTALAGAEVKVKKFDSDDEAPLGEPGELLVRGQMVMKGYFQDSDATAAALDSYGWLHTGDIASVDHRGDWRILGRLKDIIIRGGENIHPDEIEDAIRSHPGVSEVAVVGIESEYFGEEIAAWVIPDEGHGLTEDELVEFLSNRLAPFKIPSTIRFVDSLPLTASGKIRRFELAGQHSNRQSPQKPPERLELPLLDPKQNPSGGGRSETSSSMVKIPLPTSTPDSGPRPGWTRPPQPEWTPTPSNNEQEKTMTTKDRQRGKRIQAWGISPGDYLAIEATGEYPVMYQSLGTPPQREHPFNLYGDIRSQPTALAETFEFSSDVRDIADAMIDRDLTGIAGVGSGTSQFVAQVVNTALERYARYPTWDYDSLAYLRYTPPHDYTKMAVVAYSGSGSTVDTVAAAQHAKDAGAFTLAVTSIEDSPVVHASDMRLLTAGGFDTGGSDTFHYTTRVATSLLLAIELGERRNPNAHDYQALRRELLETPTRMEEMFDYVDARSRTIAERFCNVRAVLVVGSGANYGTAEEIALKFDEMCHIPAKGMSAGRHIHGALGLTDEEILTCIIAPPGESYDDMAKIAKATQMLKTPSIALVSESDTVVSEMVDYVVRLPMEDEILFSVLAVLPGQLIPYWSGVQLGFNPDTQRSNVPKVARVWDMLFPPGTH